MKNKNYILKSKLYLEIEITPYKSSLHDKEKFILSLSYLLVLCNGNGVLLDLENPKT